MIIISCISLYFIPMTSKTLSYNLVLFFYKIQKCSAFRSTITILQKQGTTSGRRKGATVNRNRSSFIYKLEGGKRKVQHLHLGVQISIYYFPSKMLVAPIMRLLWVYKLTSLLCAFDVIMTAVWWSTWYLGQVKQGTPGHFDMILLYVFWVK